MSEKTRDAATAETVRTGGCNCGAVRYEVRGPMRPVIACHCRECQRQTGHYEAATEAYKANFRLVEGRGLTWYRSSELASRGFCGVCGSGLFWTRNADDGCVSVMAGTLDDPSGLALVQHIYTAEAGSYYRVPDDLPHAERGGIDPAHHLLRPAPAVARDPFA